MEYIVINGIHVPHGTIIFEPQKWFNSCVIGVSSDEDPPCALYSYELLIDTLLEMQKEDGFQCHDSYSCAVDQLEYNMRTSHLRGWPIIIESEE